TGHIITVLGSFGTGKTTFALQFLMQGLINGEKGVFISLEEDADSVIANAASFGWDLPAYIKQKKLHIVKLEPADAKTTVTRVRSELPEFIKRSGASRVAIDSITLLNMRFADAGAEEHKYPHRLRKMAAPVKLVVFDLENTLIFNEFLPELATIVGKEAEVAAITRAGIDGRIDWEMGFRARAERLRGLTQAQVLRAA